MKIIVREFDTQDQISEIAMDLRALATALQFCTIHLDEGLDPAPLLDAACDRGTRVMGGTSCCGTMTHNGAAAGFLFGIADAEGAYGTAIVELGDDPAAAAQAATLAAIANADRVGERPHMVWVYGTPGQEESILKGIENVVGTDTPIVGGSAADNSVAGAWSVFADRVTSVRAVAIGVLYPSGEISLAYQNGYAPTEHSGVVTRVTGRRIAEIDGRPAAEVYAEWTGGAVLTEAAPGQTCSILSEATFWPLGRETHRIADVPYFLLAHPSAADDAGGLHLFAGIEEGERLTLMTGSASALTERAGRVARLALETGRLMPDDIAGAMIVFCGGCMLGVRDRLDDLVAGVREALPGVAFSVVFTFGEQGPILNTGNRHGNLMVSCILFTK
ncbi:hypothetical protein EV663_1137 [Rhodovulum bhavnagarense]|uniref:Small ligand-binding sensory domain FIST n=1 Tax=Rhodovulum bhavnagarense TaxID=992286 RepID=A0A4R2RK04_9RHOB|nr:FIST N-terminal domain-containing protein [Rhodovulum bhavnagarense]TCP60011.1 hypothetical protein EV663_1137 [Rhodovulum bhavnagarense]